MALKAEQFKMRGQLVPPENLVQGWPRDYWQDYQHPSRAGQQRAALAATLPRLKAWMDGKTPEFPGFLIYGPAGYYKTGLALSLLLFAARRGFTCRFTTAERVAVERESTTFNARDGKTSEGLLREYLGPELLVLDDLVTREYMGSVRATFLDIIRERKSLGRITIPTTNVNLATTSGQAAFENALDGRVLSTYAVTGIRADRWGFDGFAPDSLRGNKPLTPLEAK